MSRVPEEEIERLKRDVSVERLAESRGIELKAHGKDLLGLCPFHDDREPSLVITPQKNLWHCLGACQTGGSVIDWVMKAENVSFRRAVDHLRNDLGMATAAAPVATDATAPPGEKLRAFSDASVSDIALMQRVAGYYKVTLEQAPEGRAYLEKRGLLHPELIETFSLGYANRTLGYRLPDKQVKAGRELRGRLEKLGIYRESGHEHLAGSLVVPIFDEWGKVVEMYGRKVTAKLRKGTPNHLYLPGPHRGVFNWRAVKGSEEVILCESLIDAMTFWCAGYRNVTASYGTSGFTDDHRELFVESGVKKVLIAYDRDEAGDKAAKKLAQELAAEGLSCFRVQFPKGMDANEYAQKVTPAEQSLGVALRNAEWLAGVTKRAAVAPPAAASAPAASPPVANTPKVSEKLPSELPSLVAVRAAPETLPAPEADALPAAAPSPANKNATDELVLTYGDRRWRIRGLAKNTAPGVMKVNLFVSREGAGFHVDTLEIYSARQRQHFVELGAQELALEPRILKRDLGEVLLRLELEQEKRLSEVVAPKTKTPKLTDEEKAAALELLKSPRLVERILEDFDRAGIVGERTNKLVGYLAATSRHLERPLAVVIQSSSAAGKSSLMDAILSLIPEEERVEYSAMTGQSLFYMGETDLKHKILAVVEEEGAERASYALKLLQSEGKLTIASTGKDPQTGRLVTQEYGVEGPVMLFLTTTAIEVDEELLNRCIVLTVDERQEQTRAIHARQRRGRTLAGVVEGRDKAQIKRLHQNAQRLLRPLLVANPYAEELTFPDHRTRLRRDHMKYLGLIETVALLHQHQRPVKKVEHEGAELEYIEVLPSDIRLANELSREVLARSVDELPPQTRRLLGLLSEHVGREAERRGIDVMDHRFTRREVREATGWGDTQLKVHLGRLVELEFVTLHRGPHSQRYVYELSHDGEVSQFLDDLAEVGRGQGGAEKPDRSGSGRGPVGPPLRPVLASDAGVLAKPGGVNGKSRLGSEKKNGHRRGVVHVPAASLVAVRQEN